MSKKIHAPSDPRVERRHPHERAPAPSAKQMRVTFNGRGRPVLEPFPQTCGSA